MAGRSPLLRTAPLRGLRQPVLGAGIAAAAAVLALATAGTPLYRVAVGNAALAGAIEGFHEESLGLTLGTYAPLQAEAFAFADRVLREEWAVAGLPAPPMATVQAEAAAAPPGFDPRAPVAPPAGSQDGDKVAAIPPPPQTRPVLLFARDLVTDHLPEPQPCPDADGGVWVSTRLAGQIYPERCADLRLVRDDRVVDVPVAGVYRDLLEVLDTPVWDAPQPLPLTSPIARYWRRLGELLVRSGPDGTPVAQPPLVVADPHDLAALGITEALRVPAHQRWTFPFPLEGAWYLQAREANEAFHRFIAQARRGDRPVGEAMISVARQPLAVTTVTLLPAVVDRTEGLVTAVDASMHPLGLSGQAAAALVVAAAGIFEGRRRRTERRLLSAQGLGPPAAAGRAALEALLPVAAGTVAGTVLAVLLVRALAPGEPPDAALVVEVAGGVAIWAAAAVALLAATAGAQASAWQRPAFPRWAAARRPPWEAVPLLLAAASFWTLRIRRQVLLEASADGGAATIDLSYLLFPLLLLLGCGGLAARLVPRAGSAASRLAVARPGPYLAARRLARAPAAASLLIVGSAVGIGILVYASAVSASTEHSTTAAVEVLHGAPTVADLRGRGEIEGVPAGATVVSRDRAVVQPAGIEVDLLTVDPATFAGVAAWRDRFADRPLPDLLAALDRPGSTTVPLLLVGAAAGDRPSLETSRYRVPVSVVARPSAFPGMSSRRPLAVLASGTLVDAVNTSGQSSIHEALMLSRSRQLWTVHEPEEVPVLLAGQTVEAALPSTVAQARQDRPQLVAATWALAYVQAVGTAAGLLGAAALMLYLHGQQRARSAAYVLLRRLGLRRRQHRQALTLEACTLVGTALVAGAVPAVAAWIVVTSVTTLPQAVPPEFVPPWGAIGLLAPVCLLVCLAGAWASQCAADRVRAGELLRAAD